EEELDRGVGVELTDLTVEGWGSFYSLAFEAFPVDAGLPAAVANGPDLTCANGSVLLSGTGSATGPEFSYQWSTTDGNIVSGSTTLNPLIDAVGTYLLTVTNTNNGCSNTAALSIGINDAAPLTNAGPDLQLTCGAASISLDGSASATGPNYSYFWTSPDGNIVAGSSTPAPIVNAIGTYILSITDNLNGCTASDTVLVGQDVNAPLVVIEAPDSITCSTSTVLLDASNSDSGPGFSYSWSTANGSIIAGLGTLQITVSAPGLYVLEIINPNNQCVGEASATVSENLILPFADAGPDQTLTCALSELTLDGSNSATGPTISYQWTTIDGNIVSGETGLNAIVNAAGTYTLAVTDGANGCTAFSEVLVDTDAGLPTADAGPDTSLTCLQTSLQLDGSASSGIGGISYAWTTTDGNILNGADSPSPLIDAGGTYQLEVTDLQNGCTNISTVQVSYDTLAPSVVILEPDTLNCLQSSLSLDAGASGSTANFQYSWSTANGLILNGADTPFPEVGTAGTYALTLGNLQTGCTTTETVVVAQNEDLPVADAGPDQLLTCLQTLATLGGANTSTGTTFSYLWSTPSGNILSDPTIPTIQADQPGVYTLLITNTLNGCTATDEVALFENTTLPQVDAGPDTLLTCTVNSISLNALASGNTTNFIYTWSTTGGNIQSGADSLQAVVNAAGIYELLVTDTTNGCSASSSLIVGQSNDLPLASLTVNGVLNCSNTLLQLDGSASSQGPGYAFEWLSPDGNFPNGTSSLITDIDLPGTYTLSITNTSTGCSQTISQTIEADTLSPDLNAMPVELLTCIQDTVDLSVELQNQGAAPIYQWSTSGGTILGNAGSESIQVTAPGSYLLEVTNSENGCQASLSVFVAEDTTAPLVDAGQSDTLTCLDTALSLSGFADAGIAPLALTWTTADGNILSGPQSLSPVIDQAGSYLLEVTNLDNGCSASDSLVIEQDTLAPIASINAPDTLTCLQTTVSIDASATGTVAFTWSSSDGNILGSNDQSQIQVDAPGLYVLLLTDPTNGCSSLDSSLVLADTEAPQADAGAMQQLDCLNQSIQLQGSANSASGDFAVSWSTVDGILLSGELTLMPLVNATGTYILEVTDPANGCSQIDSVTVSTNENLPIIEIEEPGILNCLIAELQLDALNSDSGPDYQINWTTTNGTILSGAMGLSPVIAAPGTYELSILNTQNGCSNSAVVTVLENLEAPVIAPFAVSQLPCDQNTLNLLPSITVGSGSYGYQWTTSDGLILSGSTDAEVQVGAAGLYEVTVTDLANGCSSSATALVEGTLPLTYDWLLDEANCQTGLGSISFVAVSGGQAPYLYSIDNGNTFQTETLFEAIPPGTYTLLVEDVYGCLSETTELSIVLPEGLDLNLGPNLQITAGTEVQLHAVTTADLSTLTLIQWSPQEGLSCSTCLDPLASPAETTEYQLLIQDENGCIAQARILLEVIPNTDVYVPNAFSPDEDGWNDRFYIYAKPGVIYKIRSFLVFSRWGETVFQYYNIDPNDPAYGWDGSFRGEPMNTDVFTWFAEIEYLDGRLEIVKGDVFLRR
ncbi:MAG: gliding motility-associated C-terminal domain-containing protein, partial [Phaeodactylibacter sp.]|nr:gliding motility-associated C-terminal domain-containing protein [Phaeodactylibacter sp.]